MKISEVPEGPDQKTCGGCAVWAEVEKGPGPQLVGESLGECRLMPHPVVVGGPGGRAATTFGYLPLPADFPACAFHKPRPKIGPKLGLVSCEDDGEVEA